MRCSQRVSIKAGLGNQLFQYTYGRSLELSGKRVVFDISFFHGNSAPGDTKRAFALDKFNIKTQAPMETSTHMWCGIYKKIRRLFGMHVDEYYQVETYANRIETHIQKEFTLKQPLSLEGKQILLNIQKSQSVSIHIRRGDYVTDPKTHAYHGVCSPEYYVNAIKHITEVVGESPHFFIFTDDIIWAKKHLNLENVTFVSGNGLPDYEELMLMSACKHNIIANSSFSWWGAWLNKNTKKIVIAPKEWFAHRQKNDTDIVPSSWIRI